MAPRLRALSDPKEISAIPLDKPVLIALPAGISNAEPDGDAPAPKPAEKKPEPTQDDAAKRLQAQLEAMQAAHRADMERIQRERDEAVAASKRVQADTQKQLVTTGLARAQSDLVAAKQSLKVAMEAGDFAAAAEAQEKIARAATQVYQFEGEGAAAATEARQEPAPRPEPARTEVSDPMQAVEMSSQLLPTEKNWIKTHPETWTDRKMNIRLEDGYYRAQEKGLQRGTDAYFQFLDQHMGYARADDAGGGDEPGEMTMAAAPVSRNGGSMSGQQTMRAGEVMLSPEQREMAQSMGITEVEYAQQLVRMQQDKKANPEKYFTNGR